MSTWQLRRMVEHPSQRQLNPSPRPDGSSCSNLPVSPRYGDWRGVVHSEGAHGALLHGEVEVVAEGEAAVEAREEGTLVRQAQEGQLGLGTVREFGRGGEEPGMSQGYLM